VDHVDHVDHLILSAGLMPGGRGGYAIVDNVDNLKTISPHCPHNFKLRGGGRGKPAQLWTMWILWTMPV
jgi:hypothetical protein